jgi:hypothetical protein
MDNQDAIEVTCTDNGKKVTGYILNYKPKEQLEISLNTVKIKIHIYNINFNKRSIRRN